MNVLLVGGSGFVGRMVVDTLAQYHRVTVADLQAPAGDIGFIEVDVTDYAELQRAMPGQDALIYLAMGLDTPAASRGPSPWATSHFDVNVKGLYLTLQAAGRAGIRRIVHVSSASVFAEYLRHGQCLSHRDPDAVDGYGLAKRLGEQVAEAAAREFAISVTSLRLTGPLPDEEWQSYNGGVDPRVPTAASDVATAFLAALKVDQPGFRAHLISGDHDGAVLDTLPSQQALGWRPKARRSAG